MMATPTKTPGVNPGFDGMRAKERGLPVETCPYKPGPQRTAWVTGWFIAEVRPKPAPKLVTGDLWGG